MDDYQVVAATVTFISSGVHEVPMQERFDAKDHLPPKMWEALVRQRCIGTGWIAQGSIEVITVSYTYAKRGG